eukprot:3896665-Amphidinium_carterae.2
MSALILAVVHTRQWRCATRVEDPSRSQAVQLLIVRAPVAALGLLGDGCNIFTTSFCHLELSDCLLYTSPSPRDRG